MLNNKKTISTGIIITITIMSITELKFKYFFKFLSNHSIQLEILKSNISNLKINDKELNMIEGSIILQKSLQIKGQLECEKSSDSVSQSGGWCSKISGTNSPNHLCDNKLVRGLSKFLKHKTVASFGDGPGVYKKKIIRLHQVISYDAFDGAPYAELTTNNRVKFLDLSVPIYHLNKYDWIISLEVAEHIPAKFESVYVDNLVRHAKEGIILSWSKEGQEGHSHVNNRNADYVIKLMESKKFNHDIEGTKYLKNKSSFYWLQDNINVYRKKKNESQLNF